MWTVWHQGADMTVGALRSDSAMHHQLQQTYFLMDVISLSKIRRKLASAI